MQFSEFINEVSVSEDHYKQLDLKFIGYEEMMELYRLFSRQQNQASPQKERNGEKMQKNIESDAQKAD